MVDSIEGSTESPGAAVCAGSTTSADARKSDGGGVSVDDALDSVVARELVVVRDSIGVRDSVDGRADSSAAASFQSASTHPPERLITLRENLIGSRSGLDCGAGVDGNSSDHNGSSCGLGLVADATNGCGTDGACGTVVAVLTGPLFRAGARSAVSPSTAVLAPAGNG